MNNKQVLSALLIAIMIISIAASTATCAGTGWTEEETWYTSLLTTQTPSLLMLDSLPNSKTLSTTSSTTVTLTAVADATVKSWQPDSNFGSESVLSLSYSEIDVVREAVTLLRFDLASALPEGAIIDSATLELFLADGSGADPALVAAYFVTSSWAESNVTWNLFPTAEPIGVISQVDKSPGSYKSWQVTSFAQEWQSGSNDGVFLRGPVDGTYYERTFESREHNEGVPQLVVTYHLPSPAYTFTGNVYQGSPPDTGTPAGDVTVELWGDEDEWPEAGFERVLLTSTATSDTGEFSLSWGERESHYPHLHVIEVDPVGSYSTGAHAEEPGYVKNFNVISYPEIPSGTYGGIAFWDQLPSEKPDLNITNVWNEEGRICYQIENIGAGVAPGGHCTAVSVDGVYRVEDCVEEDIAPGAGMQRCFEYDWECSTPEDVVVVCADHRGVLEEREEDNNCMEWVFECSPPISTRLLVAKRDAYAAADDSSNNFGAEQVLRTQWYSDVNDEAIALLWFNTSDMLNQTEVITAYLSTVLVGTQEAELSPISVHEVTETWGEMTVTWETLPSYDPDPVAVTEVDATTECHVFWDITQLVQQWIDDPASNHGLALRVQSDDGGGASRVFGSRESDAIPMLTLAYTVPPIEWPEPTPPPLPPHVEVTLPVSDTAYLRWDGYEGRDKVREDPGPITLSFDARQYVMEACLLSFDLSAVPTDREIYEARLEMCLEGGENPEPVRIVANLVTMPWNAQNATWASMFWCTNEESWAPRGVAFADLEGPNWVSLDVTRHVQRWLRSPEFNYGLQLRGSDSLDEPWLRVFAGPDAGENAPRIVILQATESMGGVTKECERTLENQSNFGLSLPCPRGCTIGPLHVFFSPYGYRWQLAKVKDMEKIPPLTGKVRDSHISHHDIPATHYAHDFCVKIPKDSNNKWAMRKSNPDEIEVEWEHPVWPKWAWPTVGDGVIIFGNLVADCPHEGGRTEIHPLRGIVTIREKVAADMSKHGHMGYNLVNRADVFFSNQITPAHYGGFFDYASPCSQNYYSTTDPINYEFNLTPPNNRIPGAKLVWWEEPHQWKYGKPVKPVVEEKGEGKDAYLHVRLPYKGKSGAMHTASSIYCGWSRTNDPDLRAFKVTLHGVGIYDETEGLFMDGGEFYIWLNINDQWFNLRDYVPGIKESDTKYYGATKTLVAHVIVPNTADGKIHVRTNGYEADCFDDVYGIQPPDPVSLGALYAGCLFGGDDSDEIQKVNKEFMKDKGFGVGPPRTVNAEGNQDGKYGLNLGIAEVGAPPHYDWDSVEVDVSSDTMILDGKPGNAYLGADEISFDLSNSALDAKVRAVYDREYLWVIMEDLPEWYFDNEKLRAVIYLDPGTPTKNLPIPGYTGWDATDDLRIAFQTNPDICTAYSFGKGGYTKPVASGLVEAKKSVSVGDINVEFRIHKSLIPRGPWSTKVSEKSLFEDGIGVLLAVEKPNSKRAGAWPKTAYPTDPRVWARMLFTVSCPVSLDVARVGPPPSKVGEKTFIQVEWSVWDHPRCDIQSGELEVEVNSETLSYWKPVETCDVNLGCGIGGGGTYDKQNGKITWQLPPNTAKKGKFQFGIQLEKECPWPILIGIMKPWAKLKINFVDPNRPPVSVKDYVDPCEPEGGYKTLVNPVDTRMAPDWLRAGFLFPPPSTPRWFELLDPPRPGDPWEIQLGVRNDDDFARRVMVKAMQVPAGVSSGNPAANYALDFSKAEEFWYTVPANTEINVQLHLDLPAVKVTKAADTDVKIERDTDPGAVAVQITHPDGGGLPQTAMLQRILYLSLTPGEDNAFPVTIWHTMYEPEELHLQALTYCPDWEVWVDPGTLPAQARGTPATVQVHVRPPDGTLLGSACPIDIVAWTDSGKFVGSQRILDLPPVQASPDQPFFASSEIELEPAQPEPGDEARVCAIVRNRAETSIHADVLLGMSDRLSTAPDIDEFFSVPVEVPGGGIARACSEPFVWTGDHSFEAIIQQDGYRDQSIHRHVAIAPMYENGGLRFVSLEVRNPLATAEEISLSYKLIGLPGWQVDMPDAMTLEPGESVEVDVQLIPPEAETRPGDEGRLEVYTHTPDEQVVGGAWIQVWGCVTPTDDLHIDSDTTLCPGIYNISDSGAEGVIIINASDIVLDCNGATLKGDNSGFGILNPGFENVTIKNGNVLDYETGIHLFESDNSVISNNVVSYSNNQGISIEGSQYCDVYDNHVSFSGDRGITFGGGGNNTAHNNTVHNNSAYGAIEAIYSDNNEICNNIAYFNQWGIATNHGSNNLIRDNTIYENELGIYLDWPSTNNRVLNNEISSNWEGVWTDHNSTGNIISENLVFSNDDAGMHIETDDNTLTGNTANNNQIGLYLGVNSTGNVVSGNIFCSNPIYDIRDEGDNSGDDNTCDLTGNWNDSETTGCTYSCPPSEGPKGDLNGDGTITTTDAAIALQLAARGEWCAEADVDCDGQVTSLDALMILQAAAGNIELEGCES